MDLPHGSWAGSYSPVCDAAWGPSLPWQLSGWQAHRGEGGGSTGWVITEELSQTVWCYLNNCNSPVWRLLSTRFWPDVGGKSANVKSTNSYQGVIQKVQFQGGHRVTSDSCMLISWTTTLYNEDWCPEGWIGGREGLGCASKSAEIKVFLMPPSPLSGLPW